MLTVSQQSALKISPDQAKEMPMVDLAFLILKAANTPYYYRDLMKEIAKIKGLTEGQTMDVIAQVYTEINIDGRFACVGTNLWGLKRWYPVEKADEAISGGNTKRPRIINDEDDDDLDDDVFGEGEEDAYDAGEEVEDFDAVDAEDEFYEEEEEEVEEELDEEDRDDDEGSEDEAEVLSGDEDSDDIDDDEEDDK